LTLSAASKDVLTVVAGQKLTIPLQHTLRSEFSAANLQLKTMGVFFERNPAFDVQITAPSSQAVLDLAAIKAPPGDYRIAFYGGAVARYRRYPEGIALAEVALRKAEQELQMADAELKKLMEAAQAAAPDNKPAAEQAVEVARVKQKMTAGAVAVATEQVKKATAAANPTDIVDIVVTEPITVRVLPAEKK
ncbi:MAG: serine protease, partial [Planctomycetes bacterium]|nr:serine protease [Planctomycetota bacterium]